jgi:hypothetical protein
MADILFLNPDDVNRALDALAEREFDIEILPDAIDDCGPTVFIQATIVSTLDDDGFRCLVDGIVEPYGGDVWEWGELDPVSGTRH